MICLHVKSSCDQQFSFCTAVLSSLADLVTDMDFSPFDGNLLSTCSADETVGSFLPSVFSFVCFVAVVSTHLCIGPLASSQPLLYLAGKLCL